jgi:hypothetical protein
MGSAPEALTSKESTMATFPRDIADLSFAPVVLAIDARIDELSRLDAQKLAFQIAVEGDQPDWTLESRERGLLDTLKRYTEIHDWELSMDGRGIKVSHKGHFVVLGIPDTFRAYLAGQ